MTGLWIIGGLWLMMLLLNLLYPFLDWLEVRAAQREAEVRAAAKKARKRAKRARRKARELADRYDLPWPGER